ncbi:DUF3857 domain-containing protein [Capnocytophaga sp. ARDL2]|uniref:DUF3857 domain-containing protein n=1 Tax=Capnocytophaga sp. ARDL2 TaxID=3238809 RepID=UPI0035581F16
MKTIQSRKNIVTILTFWLSSWAIISTAQAQDLEYFKEKFPGQSEVITQYEDHYHISLTKDKRLKVTSDNVEQTMILSDKGSGFTAVESIVHSDLVNIKNYEAYTLNKNGKKVEKTAIAQITDKKASMENIFDNDVKLKVFNYANLKAGSVKYLKYSLEYQDPFLLHRFMFANNSANYRRTLKISFPEDIKVDYKLFNTDNFQIETTKETKKGIHTLTFQAKESMPVKKEANAPGWLYDLPHIHFWISEFTDGKEHVMVLGTVDRLYNYYLNFIEQINKKEHSKLKDLTLSLIEGKQTELEKLEAIFHWVQKNIKYVAFESGYEGFIPREAGLVFERKYGDCKDMSSLIVEMAKYAQIPNVNFTWIGTRELPYSYRELSIPAVDNHMIATYLGEKHLVFLDATDETVPFGMPSSFIQGKEALIAQGKDFVLRTVSVVEPYFNRQISTTNLELKQEKIEGQSKISYFGYMGALTRNLLSDKQKRRRDYLSALLEMGNNKFKLLEAQESNFDDTTKPFSIDFKFEIDNYIVASGDEYYLNMTLDKPLQNDLIEAKRKQIYDSEYLHNFSYEVNVELPKGYKVSYLPERKQVENELIRFFFDYKVIDNKVQLQYTVETRQLMIYPHQFKLWNESIKQLKESYMENIIFTKK